ncbi:hypothetical protein A5320_13845 [Rheinheimera sp. SA_1]|jgi:hypothetical protein|uniref:hypothetical protein n=1 Tax=Rheinheimera sp. SA_1 TaxID=1827365 RepID=UPI0007FF98C2|nr:hypothetical protein [Rheinheimera sp. SA_1]OBP14797.1 hypothetical protein A5320_13845 [Rheinheimera sp. SA_1]
MSLIHVIEQLGTNSALQQLSKVQLMDIFSDATTDSNQLEALLNGNVEKLSDLLQVPVYRCVTEHATEEEELPGNNECEKSIQQSVNLPQLLN